MNIAVFGLGKLGSPLVAFFADAGHDVIGVDLEAHLVQKIVNAIAPVPEPGLADMLERNRYRITATTNAAQAVRDSEAIFLVLPTPSDDSDRFSNAYVCDALATIGQAIAGGPRGERKMLVVVSTVMPGSMDDVLWPVLAGQGLSLDDVDFFYNPEFIALGSVIRNMQHPDAILIGAKRNGERLASFWKAICGFEPAIHVMGWAEAEIAKLAVNCYVTAKISFANLIGAVCEEMPGADAAKVLDFVGADSRVGKKYLSAATPYGGPCFPRDVRALNSFVGTEMGVLPRAIHATNEATHRRLLKRITELLPRGGTLAVLGTAYKPNTPVLEESFGNQLVNFFQRTRHPIVTYDPAIAPVGIGLLPMEEAVRQADVIVITTPCQEFRHINLEWLIRENRRVVILDCWRVLEDTAVPQYTDYHVVGRMP